MLLFFLSDYAQDRNDVIRRFEVDPASVYEEYGITEADLTSLRTMSENVRALLPEAIGNLVKTLLASNDEVELKWPGPQLKILDVTPAKVPRDTEVSLSLEIDVDPDDRYKGDEFTIDLVFIRAGGESVTAIVEPLALEQGPVAQVTLRCKATFTTPGAYGGLLTVTRKSTPAFPERSRFGLGRLLVK